MKYLGQVDGHLAPVHHRRGHHVVHHGLALVPLLPVAHIPAYARRNDAQHDLSKPLAGELISITVRGNKLPKAAVPHCTRVLFACASAE